MSGKETGREPTCSHCGEKCLLYTSKEFFTDPKDKRKNGGAVYACIPCRAWCSTQGVRALGGPASDDLWEFRESLKRDMQTLIRRKVRKMKVPEAQAALDCKAWIEKALGFADLDMNRITQDDANRIDALFEKVF